MIRGEILIRIGIMCYLMVRCFSLLKRHKKFVWIKEVFQFLFALYILMVASVTLFPLFIVYPFVGEKLYRSLNFIPLVSIIREISLIGIAYGGDTRFMIELIIRNVGGNILMFMPLGFMAPILFRRFKNFKNSILLGLFLSIGIEFLQFIEILFKVDFARTVDIDDVICNVLGACLGYMIYNLLMKLANKFYPMEV